MPLFSLPSSSILLLFIPWFFAVLTLILLYYDTTQTAFTKKIWFFVILFVPVVGFLCYYLHRIYSIFANIFFKRGST